MVAVEHTLKHSYNQVILFYNLLKIIELKFDLAHKKWEEILLK